MKNYRKIAPYLLLVIFAAVLIHYSLLSLRAFSDFAPYYHAAERFIRGETLYNFADGHYLFKYSPLAAMLFIPFALLPYGIAKVLWLIISWLLLALCYFKSGNFIADSARLPAWAILLIWLGISKFVLAEIHLGQIDFLLLFLALLTLLSLQKKWEFWGGVLLALGCLIKPPLLLLLLLPLWRRRASFMGGFLAGVSSGVVAPLLRYGIGDGIQLYRGWWDVLTASSPGLLASNVNQSIFGALTRWLPTAGVLPLIIGALVMLVYVIWLYWLDLRRTPSAVAPQLVLLGSVLLSPLGWVQNYVFCLPALLTAFHIGQQEKWFNRRRIILLAAFFLTAVLPNYELLGREFYNIYLGQSWIFIGMVCLIIAVSGPVRSDRPERRRDAPERPT